MSLPAFKDLKYLLQDHKLTSIMSPTLWEEDIDFIEDFLNRSEMKSIKFFNNDCTAINSSISSLANDKGGIYFFMLKSPLLPNLVNKILYIGRAQITDSQNLRKRCRVYFNKYYKSEFDRPHIHTMLNVWQKHLYLYFIELDDNDEIKDIEKKLINNIIPPFNNDIPSTEISRVKRAISAW